MYLPLAALVALSVVGAHHCTRQRTAPVLVAGAIVALAFAWFTAQRGDVFQSEIAIWTDTVTKRPTSARAQGLAPLLRANRVTESMAASAAALRLRPRYPEAHVNLGVALAHAGRIPEAISHYETALRDAPHHGEAHYNLGIALVERGRPAESIAHFAAALLNNAGNASAHNNLAVALLQLGRAAESMSRPPCRARQPARGGALQPG